MKIARVAPELRTAPGCRQPSSASGPSTCSVRAHSRVDIEPWRQWLQCIGVMGQTFIAVQAVAQAVAGLRTDLRTYLGISTHDFPTYS